MGTPEFESINKHYKHANSITNWKNKPLCDTGGKVIVEMNMITMKAKITFLRNKESENVYDIDDKKPFVFEINLPDDVAIIIEVLDQQFSYL